MQHLQLGIFCRNDRAHSLRLHLPRGNQKRPLSIGRDRHLAMSAIGTKRTSQSSSAMSAFGGRADIKLTRPRPEPVKEKRAGARPDRGGASADFLEACPPDIAGGGKCLGQTEAEYNGSNSKHPWIHRHGEPQRVSANILAQAEQFYPFKSPTSASGPKRTLTDNQWMSAFGGKADIEI
jgi:hypothetical protein